MIKCPNCNAELNFDVDSQLVTCNYCRTTFDPHKLDVKTKNAQELIYEGKSYLCSQCGSKLLTFDETAITFCSYCGSQAMIESKMIKQNNPDFIIPFKKTKDECIKSYKNKISKFLYAPKYMKSDIIVNKFRGIYIPYCVYKLSYHDKYTSKGSKYRYRSGDYVYYDDYKVCADVDADYQGISYDLISNFYDKFSHSIPYDFKTAEEFNPNFLAGFYADVADVKASLYEKNAKEIVDADLLNRLGNEKKFSRYGCAFTSINTKVSEKKVGMFPVYFLAMRDKKNKYVSYAVINGQTGEIAVDIPIDFKKYILMSMLLAIPIFLLINSFIVLKPTQICILFIISSVLGIIIGKHQYKKIYERQNHLDDEGYLLNHPKTESIFIFKKSKIKKFLVPLLFLLNIFIPFIFPMSLNLLLYMIIVFAIFFCWLIRAILSALDFTFGQTDEKKLKNTIKLRDKIKITYKYYIAIFIGVITLLLNFVEDIYYYGASLIMFGFIICGFFDLIKGHNLIVSTKLPQLNKRGGDENE